MAAMNVAVAAKAPSLGAVQKFFATPKGLLTIAFIVLVAVAAPREGVGLVAGPIAAAVAAGVAVDLPILRLRNGAWSFPSGAILTGLIVAMVQSPHERWYVAAATSAIAIASKYVVRTHSANVFNPAALALVISFHVFGTGQDWWGALPDLPPAAMALLLALGIFIANRVNKLPMVLAFLGVYYCLFTASAFAGDPARVAEIFRTPDLQAVLYFAFFILTDPPTSPTRYRDQVVCAVIVAVVSYGIFTWAGVVYYLLAGVLAGNVWEGWRRHRARARRHLEPKKPHRVIPPEAR
jgi:Na+-translocating ferredoxin:NAD+ oxidoreductase RnfD subunit